ncbi:P-loop containing nucleoside triphosphate hydrolase protein, partial [Absidia repens]
MAKKKKVTNTRGYATTSLPSKKSTTTSTSSESTTSPLATPPQPNIPSPATQNTTSQPTTTTSATTNDSQQPTEIDDVERLVKRFENLHTHKSNVAIEKLGQSAVTSTIMSDLNIKEQSFSLKSELEQDILDVITDQQKTSHLAFCRPIRRRASQTEKDRVVGKMDVAYLALTKLGFDPMDIQDSFHATVSTDMDAHLDWLCLNVPYERMPVGYYDTYFSKEGVKISLEQAKATKNNKVVDSRKAEDEHAPVPPSIPLSQSVSPQSQEPLRTSDDDNKRRILEAYMYDDDDEDEEADINETYAKTKMELTQLEMQVNGDSNKKKKKKTKPPNGPELSEKDMKQAKRKMDQLKQTLQALEQDWDFDKRKADAFFITEQRLLSDQRRQQQQQQESDPIPDDDENITNEPSTNPLDSSTNNDDEEEEEGGMFGFMDSMEVEGETAAAATTTAVTAAKEWRLVDVRLPASWKGRTPKQILEDQSNSRGFVKCRYSRLNKAASTWQASVSLFKKHASEPGLVVHLPDGLATDKPVDAEQLVAAAALFQLDPQSSIYQIMATPFKDLWTEWKQKKFEEDEAPRIAADRQRVQFILDTLNDSFDTSPKAPKPLTNIDAFSSDLDLSYEKGPHGGPGWKKRKQVLFGKVQQHFNQRLATKAYLQMKLKREELPIADYRQEILQLVQAHQVVIISGETGCGKSTQVPQFLAEHLLRPGTPYGSVICTQPRRISAMSIAQRVSYEMTDRPKAIGTKDAMVGYQIRLESKVSDENVLMFCTTGILLRRLESDPLLEGISHVIVDEVHERSIDSDFLLVVLQRICRVRSDLRVILMSATVNAERFSDYFRNCPIMSVPGRTYPVNVQYLEDIVETTGYVLEEDSYYAVKKARTQTNQGNINVSGQHGSSKRVHYEIFDEDSDSDDIYHPSTQQQQSKLTILEQQDGDDNEDIVADGGIEYSRQTRKMIKRMDENKINYDLMINLLEHITKGNNDDETIPTTGAILIFLPGMPEIRKLYDMVSAHSVLGDPTKTLLIALHSTLSSEHQEKAFDVPPKGIRKIVFATNIAETGITISDVTIVIDTGMAKIVSYDQEKRMTRLRQMYVAKANVNQRKGRAGRVQEGLCYHLFTKDKYESLANYETPEILRLPLEELCLRIKVCNLGGSIEQVLGSALDAPSSKMVKNAIETLQQVQALADDESQELTPLGAHLSHLPVDVHIGKMILFGAIFRCLDPILTIAAALSFKSPFVRPFGNEDEADKAREQFKQGKLYDSDFLSVYKAYSVWREELIRVRGSGGGWQRKMHQFCKRHYLSHKNLETIEEMKKQYLELLVSIGFVKHNDVRGEGLDQKYSLHHRLRLCQIPSVYNQYGTSIPMINAAITAGLYPKVALYHPDTRSFVQHDMLHRTIHPSSCLFKKENQLSSPFLVYNTVVMNNDRIYLWETASIDAVAVLLLANDMTIKHHQKMVIVDHWIKFNCFARTAVLIKFLRHELKTWLQGKMDDPSLDLTTTSQAVMELMVKTLEAGH